MYSDQTDKLRSAAWKAFLLSDLSMFVESHDPELHSGEDPALPKDVGAFLEQRSIPSSQVTPSFLVSAIEFYFSTRRETYCPERRLAEIALVLRREGGISDLEDLQWCLLSFCNRFVPEPDSRSSLVNLFRHLISYHDPHLLALLETKKVNLEGFCLLWLGTAFAGVCRDDVTASVWSQLFSQPDPFLLIFMGYALLTSIGDQLEEMPARNVQAFITRYPESMQLEDVKDCLMFANYFLNRTPSSFRDVYAHIFKGGTSSPHFGDLSVTSFCIPISVRDVLSYFRDESIRKRINYFFIDCRSSDDFSAGHQRGSIHISCEKLLDDPSTVLEEIDQTLASFREAGKKGHDHICLIGYTEDDPSPANGPMATLTFLSQLLKLKIPRVSYLIEGFRGLHDCFLEDADVLEDHTPRFCPYCARRNSLGNTFVSETVEKGVRIFDELKSTVMRTVSKSKNSSIFSFIKSQYSSLSDGLADSVVSLESVKSGHDHCFEISEIMSDDSEIPGVLCLSQNGVDFYNWVDEGKCRLYRSKSLEEIVKISTKSADSDQLTLRFGRLKESEVVVESAVAIRLSDPRLLVDSIKHLIQSL